MDETQKLQDSHRELLVLLADFNDIEKRFSRLRNEILMLDKRIVEEIEE